MGTIKYNFEKKTLNRFFKMKIFTLPQTFHRGQLAAATHCEHDNLDGCWYKLLILYDISDISYHHFVVQQYRAIFESF